MISASTLITPQASTPVTQQLANETVSQKIKERKEHFIEPSLSLPYVGTIDYPFIIVYTYKSKVNNTVIKGSLHIGDEKSNTYLDNVLAVQPMNQYCYFFNNANLKQHMVVNALQAEDELNKLRGKVTHQVIYAYSLINESFVIGNSEFYFFPIRQMNSSRAFPKRLNSMLIFGIISSTDNYNKISTWTT